MVTKSQKHDSGARWCSSLHFQFLLENVQWLFRAAGRLSTLKAHRKQNCCLGDLSIPGSWKHSVNAVSNHG